jgi:manganese-transporting P-type ATPase
MCDGNINIDFANSKIRPPLVDNSQIKAATLHNPLPLFAHTYIWPFLLVWPVFFSYYLSNERYATYIGAQEWTFVWSGTIITFQALAWLVTKWSVDLNALFTSTKVKNAKEAQLIKVHPIENAGAAEICKLERDTVSWYTC